MISILIPVKDEEKFLDQSLTKIFSQDIDEKFEVIIVDSGSTDNTLCIIKKYDVKLYQIPSNAYHHSKTRNLLASKANGEILVFTVGDAIPFNNRWLKSLIEYFEEDENIAAAYSRQIPRKDTNPVDSQFIKSAFPPYRIEKNKKYLYDYDKAIHWDNFIFFSDVSAAYRKDIWEKYKFNENLKYGEDQDIAKRMLLDGYTIVYNPESVIIHSHTESNLKTFKRNVEIACAFRQIVGAKARLITLPIMLFIHGKYFYSQMKKEKINRPLYWTIKSITRNFYSGIGRFVGYHYNKIPEFVKSKVKLLP